MQQLIYRLELNGVRQIPALPCGRFVDVAGAAGGVAHLVSLLRSFGVGAGLKALLKVLTPRRRLIGVAEDGRWLSSMWLTYGQCRHYPVESDAVVIGPVQTLARMQGKGLATACGLQALSLLANEGVRVVYVDTSEMNVPMQAVIRKCGFGEPVKRMER